MSTFVKIENDDPRALQCIAEACGGDAGGVISDLSKDPNMMVLDSGNMTAVIRVEPGNELVIVAASGKELVNTFAEFIEWIKQNSPHIKSIRLHTQKKAILRLWKKAGMEVNEWISRIKL